MNCYEVLGVNASASNAEIAKAYRDLCQKLHPDKGGNAYIFNLVNKAYATLSGKANPGSKVLRIENIKTPIRHA